MPQQLPVQQFAMPGHPGTFSTIQELSKEIMHASRTHGFNSEFVYALCTLCSAHLAVHPMGELCLNAEVAPRTAVNDTKLKALGRYVGAFSNRHVQVHVVRSHTVADKEMKVILIGCPQGAQFGTVLHSQVLKIESPCMARANLKVMGRVFYNGARTAYTNLISGETKTICAIVGMISLLIAAIFPGLRTAVAAVGATTAGVALASRRSNLDGILGPFNDGVNIGTAIPSGQQLTEMFASGSQNFTFALVSCWHGVSLLLARILINLDQNYLDAQTFVIDEKRGVDDVRSVMLTGLW